jgi:hypothetical protein
MTEEKLKISRIDSQNKAGHTQGWFVREYYEGLIISCLFSDKKYGGTDQAKEKAKSLAKSWRELREKAKASGQNLYDWYSDAESAKTNAKRK